MKRLFIFVLINFVSNHLFAEKILKEHASIRSLMDIQQKCVLNDRTHLYLVNCFSSEIKKIKSTFDSSEEVVGALNDILKCPRISSPPPTPEEMQLKLYTAPYVDKKCVDENIVNSIVAIGASTKNCGPNKQNSEKRRQTTSRAGQ